MPMSPSNMPQAVVSFDAAGTLIQVREPVASTYAAHALRHGLKVPESALKQAFRQAWATLPPPERPEGVMALDDDRAWWRLLVGEVFVQATGSLVEETVLEPLFAGLYDHYASHEAWIVYDEVQEVLEHLYADYRLCVLSNFDRRLRRILAGHGLDHWFEHIFLSSEIGAAKPHPRMFQTALREMSAQAPAVWHVGDDFRCDFTGAQAAGWQAFHLQRPEQSLWDFVKKVRD